MRAAGLSSAETRIGFVFVAAMLAFLAGTNLGPQLEKSQRGLIGNVCVE